MKPNPCRSPSCRATIQLRSTCKTSHRTTYICKLEYSPSFQFHVFALDLPSDLVDRLCYELGFIGLVRTQPANQILESSLPHSGETRLDKHRKLDRRE